jgi:hypothetical protein
MNLKRIACLFGRHDFCFTKKIKGTRLDFDLTAFIRCRRCCKRWVYSAPNSAWHRYDNDFDFQFALMQMYNLKMEDLFNFTIPQPPGPEGVSRGAYR